MTRTALYRHYDADGALLYVGISDTPDKRLKQHQLHSAWAEAVASTHLVWFDNRAAAEDAERAAIRTEAPAHNVLHRAEPRVRAGAFRATLMNAMARNGTGITQLAREAEVSRDVLNKLMARAGASTTVENAIRIAEFYDLNVNEFIATYAEARP